VEDPGQGTAGPPWVLGHRGSPREAPENTLASLRAALDAGADGIEYDVHACASGEPVLIHDETMERTTDGTGPVREITLPELAGIDAGGWFHPVFQGEPLPLLEEALELPGPAPGRAPFHMIELKEAGLVGEVARQLNELARPLPVRIASFLKDVCLEARDHDLMPMLLGVLATESDRRFVRDEGIAAYGTGPGGWRTEAGLAEWPCERWSWSVDDPEDLLEAMRAPLMGINTNEPRRAMATRTLVGLTPGDDRPYPLRVPVLEVRGAQDPSTRRTRGEWAGSWETEIGISNPLDVAVKVDLELMVRGGAFEISQMPERLRLEPGEAVSLPVKISGGSWSPGGDPLVAARFHWGGRGKVREFVLDASLKRLRVHVLGEDARRLPMLCERPGEMPASMTVRRKGNDLVAWVEDPGGLEDVRAKALLGMVVRTGGRGVRVPLPEGFDGRTEGLPFSVAFEGRVGGSDQRTLRRWAGGLPATLASGSPGRLLPASSG